jgi:aldehyde:ferredoxin oxidoreductase
MGTYYILKEMQPKVEALSPENILTFFLGPATGLPISGQSRMTANAKSPLTGAIGDAQCGGFFPAEMKWAGYDGIVIRGKSPKPVYLWIKNGEVEIRDASHIWGKPTGDAENILKDEVGDQKTEVLQIGPAGENLVRFAAIMNMVNRANGRTGMGAVMGSKNLKAVVVRGSAKTISAANPKLLTQLFRDGTSRIPDTPAVDFLHVHGTTGDVAGMHGAGGLPTHNFNRGQFSGYETIAGELMTETILVERDTCFSCTVRCKRVVETEFNNTKVLPRFGGPEYETMATFGSYCGVDDLHAVSLANQLSNQLGLDTISCGATIAFAMECFENGVITLEDTGGIDLHFGNAVSMVRMVEMIGHREGFGNVLAEGSEKAAAIIGKNASDFLITAKGQETPAHMPQHKRMMGLLYAVNPFGADHMSAEHDPFIEEGADAMAQDRVGRLGFTEQQVPGSITDVKVQFMAKTQCAYSALDTFCLCSFVFGVGWQLYSPEETAQMLHYATGWEDLTADEVLEVGERRINMMRAFNAREGFGREQDGLKKKFFKPLLGPGPNEGAHYTPEQFEHMKDVYYEYMGWDPKTAVPSRAKLESLGLGWIEI